jgi:hypothetical protein
MTNTYLIEHNMVTYLKNIKGPIELYIFKKMIQNKKLKFYSNSFETCQKYMDIRRIWPELFEVFLVNGSTMRKIW